jgi:hypothetical protein
LTLNISDQCIGIPAATRRRAYKANLELSSFGYLGVRIGGGGYAQPVVIGDLQAGQQNEVILSWNDFDFGCYDVYPEQLDASSRLTVCGRGSGTRDGSTIAGALNASVWIDEAGVRGSVCHGSHEFSFTRTE